MNITSRYYLKILFFIFLMNMHLSAIPGIFAFSTAESKNIEVWLNIYLHGIMSLKPLTTISNFVRFLTDDISNSLYLDTVNLMRDDPFFFQAQAMQVRGLQRINLNDQKIGAAASAMANIFEMVQQINPSNRLLPKPVRVDGALRLAQDELRECLSAEALAKAGETSPLGSYGASIEANGGKIWFQKRSNVKNYYYTYGWSGLFSKKAQYNDARDLLLALEKEVAHYRTQGIQPKIRLFGYSHGGTVVLKLGMVKQKENLEPSFGINEAFLLGTPIQYDTDLFINDPIFKKVYNIFSRSDRVQKLDILTCNQYFLDHIFKNHGTFVVPKKLVQIEIRVIRKKGEAKKPLEACANQSIDNGKKNYRDFRNVSPGHIELWFFGWTPKNYRATFPLYPLPILAFMPFIIKSIEPWQPDCKPEVPITITIDVHRNAMLVNNHVSQSQPYALPFIGINNFLKLKDFALKFKPDPALFNQKIYDEHTDYAYNQAVMAHAPSLLS